MHHSTRFSRRGWMAGLGGTLGAAAGGLWLNPRRVFADEGDPNATTDPAERRLLFVVCATGGASIIDSFLPVAIDEVPSGVDAGSLNAYPTDLITQPTGSNIRGVLPVPDTNFLTPGYSIAEFLGAHYADLTVVAHDVTSVNHQVAQKRALTGAGIDRGRTIAEAVAARYGLDLPLANCNMATEGYVTPGDDASLPVAARSEIIADPRMYAMSTHGSRGQLAAPATDVLARARRIREGLEEVSPFGLTYRDAPLRQRYLNTRSEISPQLEAMDAITKLMLLPSDAIPQNLGVSPSPLGDAMRTVLPGVDRDNWHQQGALAFLLSYYGLSCASTISLRFDPSFDGDAIVGAPLAFDFSHQSHRAAQNVMWGRVLQVVDGLVRLLKEYDYLGDPALGKMWDRSLIYVASDFGRDKVRPAGNDGFGTGHHLNNGSVLLSPLLRGNQVFGGVDPATLLTYGFDGRTGEADPNVTIREGEVYSVIAQALDVDFPGRRDMSGLLA